MAVIKMDYFSRKQFYSLYSLIQWLKIWSLSKYRGFSKPEVTYTDQQEQSKESSALGMDELYLCSI